MRALYVHRVHEHPRYENGKPHWVDYTGVTCKKEYINTWYSMANREECLRNRRERDRLRRRMETAEEQEARFINALITNAVQ